MRTLRAIWGILHRKNLPQTYKPVILVTGCASGIGLSIARLLHKQAHYRVVITAREKSLQKLKEEFQENDHFMIQPLDVTSVESRMNLLGLIQSRWGGVDILVNNAGISYRTVLEHMDDESELHQMSTNYLGPVSLMRLVIPYMRERGRGKIINISSVSGMLAMPTMASYSASKHALEGASEALWYEMRPLGINVSLVQPGFVRSGAFKNVYYSPKAREANDVEGPYSDYYREMAPFVEKLMKFSSTTPQRVANLVLKIIHKENPPLWVPATIDAVVFYYLRRFIPRRFFHTVLFYLLPHATRWGKNYSNARSLKQ
jgi:short-subunit dehydrogenase